MGRGRVPDGWTRSDEEFERHHSDLLQKYERFAAAWSNEREDLVAILGYRIPGGGRNKFGWNIFGWKDGTQITPEERYSKKRAREMAYFLMRNWGEV